MNNNFISMWSCVICSTIFQAVSNYSAGAFWFGLAVIYAVFAIIEAVKK